MSIRPRPARLAGARWSGHPLTLAAALAIFAGRLPHASAATTVNWTDGTGNWATAANWTTISSTHAVPAAGDTVNITATDGVSRTITYNYTGTAISLGALTIDLTNYSGAATTTLSMSANALSVTGAEVVANNGTGNFNESGGTNTINSGYSLIIGYNSGSSGTYTLSGTGALSVTGTAYVGYSGTGNFNQTGGTNTMSGGDSLYLAFLGGSAGTYTLSGSGALSTAGYEEIGYNGTGNFNQSGGTNTMTGGDSLYLGFLGGSTGTYTLSGSGAFSTAGYEFVGYSGTGNFNQTGGTNTLTTGSLYLGYNTGSSGTYTLSGTGALSVGDQEYIGLGGTGNFNQSGGTHTLISGSALYLGFNSGSTGTYTLSGSGTLATAGYEYIGYSGIGNFNQTGGTHTISLGYGLILSYTSGSGGTYTLSGAGALSVSGNEYVGYLGTGNFNQSGGTNTLNVGYSLDLGISGSSIGTYNLSGGSATLNGGGSVFVGGVLGMGTGILNVSGTGVLTISGELMVYPNTATCAVNLSGGTINTAGLNFNGVPALLNWTGGTLNLTTNVTFDSGAALTSTANAFGPSLTLGSNQALKITGNETLGGTGAFGLILNSGSSHYVTGTLTLSPTGTITQNSGSTLYASTFTQAGGTVNGILQNQGNFIYQSGQFNGRLLNQGTVNLGPSFTAGNGMENDAAIYLSPGETVTLNGAGLDNLGSLQLGGATLAGSGPATNDYGGTIYGPGAIGNSLTNLGTLVASGLLHLNGASNTNSGIVEGSGTILGNFANSAAGTVIVSPGSTLSIISPWTNAGLVTLQGSGAVLGSGTITNATTIQGAGAINAPISNSTGVIRASGGELDLTGAGDTNDAGGQIQSAAGNTVLFTQGLAINAGVIALAGGTFDNNNQPLSNTGTLSGNGVIRTGGLANAIAGLVLLTDSPSSVYGPVTNNGHIHIINTTTFFYGNVNNASGTIEVTASTARFLGNGVSMTVGGTYISDPSNNYFNGLAIIPGGSVSGGAGDGYFLTGNSAFTDAGTFTNAGSLSAYTVNNSGQFTQTGGLTETGNFTNSGAATISGPQTWTAGSTFTNSAGSATFSSDTGSASSSPLSITITGGNVNLAATQHLNALTVTAGQSAITAGTTKTNSLTLGGAPNAWTGDVDIGHNKLIVEATALTKTGVLATLLNQAFYGTAHPNGITSDALAAHTGIAIINNGTLGSPFTIFGGVSVDANSILIAPELRGDANLDGTVNFADFVLLSNHFGQSDAGWSGGDFNNDGLTNFADFVTLSNNFGQTLAASELATTSPPPAAIPEPATLPLLALAATLLLPRRRHASPPTNSTN